MRTLLIILFLGLSCPATYAQQAKPGKQGGYYIDTLQVTQVEFDKYLKPLKEVEGTWFCAETTTGGITGYRMKDEKGTIYEYETATDKGKNISSIKKEPVLK